MEERERKKEKKERVNKEEEKNLYVFSLCNLLDFSYCPLSVSEFHDKSILSKSQKLQTWCVFHKKS